MRPLGATLLLGLVLSAVQLPTRGDTPEPAVTADIASRPVEIRAPSELALIDRPDDDGTGLLLVWPRMDYDGPQITYEILMSESPDGPFISRARIPGDSLLLRSHPHIYGDRPEQRTHNAVEIAEYVHAGQNKPAKLRADQRYYVKLRVLGAGHPAGESQVVDGVPLADWFSWKHLNVFVAMVLLSATILFFVWYARRNPGGIFIRRIGGLEAVDDAMGRAAEMGKPVYFCHGLGGVGDVVTISSINMLGKIAERTAEYGAQMKVTCFDVLVMQVSQEMVKQAAVRVGRPDAYREEDVFYISSDQFAYATAVEGLLLRDMPATVFFFGQFQAESLLLSETGAVTKAIQVAGTDVWGQIPFFITTCDYTLIGEEMYAASAYLSREAKMLGAVKGQDAVKGAIILLIIAGTTLASLGLYSLGQWLITR